MESYTNDPGERLDLPSPAVALQGKTLGGARYEVMGNVMQTVSITLSTGSELYAEPGALSWMDNKVDMQTNMGSGGLMGALGRAFTGESIFVVRFKPLQDGAKVAFSSEFPGKIIPINLGAGQSIIAQKDTMLVADSGVGMSVAFQKKLSAGLFGGEGFLLQKFEGPGTLFTSLDGEIVEMTLGAGEVLKVDTGHVAMFEPSVSYDIQMVKGIKNVLFGGEGLFFAQLTGPGRVWLQTMPMSKLAGAIKKYFPTAQGSNQGLKLDFGG